MASDAVRFQNRINVSGKINAFRIDAFGGNPGGVAGDDPGDQPDGKQTQTHLIFWPLEVTWESTGHCNHVGLEKWDRLSGHQSVKARTEPLIDRTGGSQRGSVDRVGEPESATGAGQQHLVRGTQLVGVNASLSPGNA